MLTQAWHGIRDFFRALVIVCLVTAWDRGVAWDDDELEAAGDDPMDPRP